MDIRNFFGKKKDENEKPIQIVKNKLELHRSPPPPIPNLPLRLRVTGDVSPTENKDGKMCEEQQNCSICKGSVDAEKCKCVECMQIFCSTHLKRHTEKCIKVCRFCNLNEKETILVKCGTSFSYYCKKCKDLEDSFVSILYYHNLSMGDKILSEEVKTPWISFRISIDLVKGEYHFQIRDIYYNNCVYSKLYSVDEKNILFQDFYRADKIIGEYLDEKSKLKSFEINFLRDPDDF